MTEQKKGLILVGLLAVAGMVWYVDTRGGTIRDVSNSPDRPYTPLQVDSLALRGDKLDRSRSTEYKSSGRDLFTDAPLAVASNSAPQKVEPRYQDQGPQLPPPPEPPKLPANVKYFGYGTVPNGTSRRAFLTNGDEGEPLIVSEGDTLLGKYRVIKIGNANLEFEDVTTGMRGSAPLEEQAAPPA
jgi:hypothetical protein